MELKQIIHRDIKPANLLINKDAIIKLCDFGISRSFTQMNAYFNSLNDEQFSFLSPLLHTEYYMPPTIKGNIQDDMWSLGITLIEIILGRNPFHSWTSNQRYNQIIIWQPSFPQFISNQMKQIILNL